MPAPTLQPISGLPSLGGPLSDPDLFVIVQGGVTYKGTALDILNYIAAGLPPAAVNSYTLQASGFSNTGTLFMGAPQSGTIVKVTACVQTVPGAATQGVAVKINGVTVTLNTAVSFGPAASIGDVQLKTATANNGVTAGDTIEVLGTLTDVVGRLNVVIEIQT